MIWDMWQLWCWPSPHQHHQRIGNLLRCYEPTSVQHLASAWHSGQNQKGCNPRVLYQDEKGLIHRGNYTFFHPVAAILSPRHWHLLGGPGLDTLEKQKISRVAITNTATYPLEIGQNDFIGALDQWTDIGKPQALEQMVKKFKTKLEAKTQCFMTNQETKPKASLKVPSKFRQQYLALLQKSGKVISVS